MFLKYLGASVIQLVTSSSSRRISVISQKYQHQNHAKTRPSVRLLMLH